MKTDGFLFRTRAACKNTEQLSLLRICAGDYFMPFSYASIIFLTIWPPTEPA